MLDSQNYQDGYDAYWNMIFMTNPFAEVGLITMDLIQQLLKLPMAKYQNFIGSYSPAGHPITVGTIGILMRMVIRSSMV